MLAVEALETWTWWPHLSNFRLDVLIVVFSGSDSFFSNLVTRREREREERERERERRGKGGGGQRLNRTYMAGVNFAFSSMPKRCACRGETSETRR